MISRPKTILLTLTLSLVTLSLLVLHPTTRSSLIDLPSRLAVYKSDSIFRHHSGIASLVSPADLRIHPLLELVEAGGKKAAKIQKRRDSIRTLHDAVRDYRRAFGMAPPEGFEIWYELAVKLNSTTAPSLIPLALTSVLPFLSLPPAELRARANATLGLTAMCGARFSPEADNGVELVALDNISGRRTTPAEWLTMFEQDAHRLPPAQNPEHPLVLPIWADDSAFRMVDGDIMEESRRLARAGQVWDPEVLAARESEAESRFGWQNTCPTSQSASARQKIESATRGRGHRFVSDLVGASDYCEHPSLLDQSGELLMRRELPLRPLAPVLVIGKPLYGAEMVGPPTQITNHTIDHPLPWENRTDSRLLWRGQISGIYHIDQYPWRQGPRDRLAFAVNKDREADVSVLADRGLGMQVSEERWARGQLVDQYLDIGLVKENLDWHCGLNGAQFFACNIDEKIRFRGCPGSGVACEEMKAEHEWKERVSTEEAQKYKFVLDVDGYGWSSRWRKELSSGSVIIKSTIYTEWWTEQAVPWYHFVPSLYDYSDLFDIMSFFTGPPGDGKGEGEGEGEEEGRGGRDDLAREIGRRGAEFARERLRWEDMRSYMFLLLLEYRRAWSDDRIAASFPG